VSDTTRAHRRLASAATESGAHDQTSILNAVLGLLTVSSIVLYPVAVLIWVVTVAFDRRLVLLHRFTCFWASLYTWFNPVWPVTLEGGTRSGRAPPT
jgi:hypothetical protein